jgi:hypothetical protein
MDEGNDAAPDKNVVTYDDLIAYTYGFGPAEFQTKRKLTLAWLPGSLDRSFLRN